MKIAYFISNVSSKSESLGGHYRSMKSTLNMIKKSNEVLVIVLGNKNLNLSFNNIKTIYIRNKVLYPFYSLMVLYKIIRQERPDVINSFDRIAHFEARIIGYLFSIPYVFTKCGGENPKYYYPVAENIIVYSMENYKYFVESPKFSNSKIKMFPNRVNKFKTDKKLVCKVIEELQLINYKYIFLRISRINEYYYSSIKQLISLIKKLQSLNTSCCAIIIGKVEDNSIVERLNNKYQKHIYFLTDHEFTSEARRLLDIGDFVLGTGRGFMEASSLGKVMLSPIMNSSIPLLITKETFNKAFEKNFSERLYISNFDENNNFINILELLRNPSKIEKFKLYSKKMYGKYFDIDTIEKQYNNYYNNLAKDNTIYLYDLILHLFFNIKRIYF